MNSQVIRKMTRSRNKGGATTIGLLLAAASVADAHRFVIRNETLPACSASCKASDIERKWYWQKQEVTATLTAATVVLVIDERTNTTRTETITNELPDGITIPATNSAGTQTTTIQLETAKGVTAVITLTYPGEFKGYPLSYNWKGVLPTVNALGQPVCSTAPSAGVWIDYNSYTTPLQRQTATVDSADPKGYLYSLQGFGCVSPADATINPNDAAPKLCSQESICGVSALQTALLLTETSIRRESSTPSPTQPPANLPPPSQNTPPAQNNSPPAQNNPPPAQNSPPPAQVTPPAQNNSPAPAPSPNNPVPQATAGSGGQEQPAPQPSPGPIVVGSQTFAVNSQSNFVIGSQTLTQGGQIVAAGTTISLAQGGTAAVVNGATQTLLAQPAPVVVAGNTLSVGGAPITLGNGASATIVRLTINTRGQTVAIVNGQSSTVTADSTDDVGNAIASGIGVQEFTGTAPVKSFWSLSWILPFTALVSSLI